VQWGAGEKFRNVRQLSSKDSLSETHSGILLRRGSLRGHVDG
jgi:hypothetical protein